MKLKELIEKYNFEEVFQKLIELYPKEEKNKKGYKNAYTEMKELTNSNIEVNPKSKIIVEYIKKDKLIEEPYWSVSLLENNMRYAIELSQWKDLMNYNCKIKNMEEIDFLAHVIWELTFMGYSQKEIKKEYDKITKLADKAKKEMSKKKYTKKQGKTS